MRDYGNLRGDQVREYGRDWRQKIIAPQTQILNRPRRRKLGVGELGYARAEEDSDHPANHSDQGPSWVASVVNAIGESSYWSTSAIIVVWDDWGGFYDNAAAAATRLSRFRNSRSVPHHLALRQARLRIAQQYEFGSILKFIEEVYGNRRKHRADLTRLHRRRANELRRRFDFSQKPREFSPIPSKYPRVALPGREPPSNEPVDNE